MAGAKHVYAIEASDMALTARKLIADGLPGKVSVLKGKCEQIWLPVESVDISVSEWMGSMLVCESMLFMRDRYLNTDGTNLFFRRYQWDFSRHALDMHTVTEEWFALRTFDLNFTVERDGFFTGFAGWFETVFSSPRCAERMVLDTSLMQPKTHWAQTLFLITECLPVAKGGRVRLIFEDSINGRKFKRE